MAFDDKVDNKSEELAGKVKEGVGKATDDERLEAEGKAVTGPAVRSRLYEAGYDVRRETVQRWLLQDQEGHP